MRTGTEVDFLNYSTACYGEKELFDDAAVAAGDEVGEVGYVFGVFG